VVISVHTLFSAFLQGKGANTRGRLLKCLADHLYRRADAVVAVSRGVALDLQKTFDLPQGRIRIIGNPFDFARISQLARLPIAESIFIDGTPIILSAGRLAPEKGGENLLHAFSLLLQKTDARLVFLGEGPEQTKLEQLCERLEIGHKVSFLGYRSNPFQYMAQSTVFVLPSHYEGFGNVLVEAMACGLPVVATHCYQGIEEIVDPGETGLLVEVGDEEAMAAAILRLLEDDKLRVQLSERALARVDAFGIERITEQYSQVLGLTLGRM
jgi:glycosyltransferase involved in cell wall biosynthesis